MFIQTEHTPNPASLKFLPGCEVMLRGTADFTKAEEAGHSPLAKRLFAIAGVRGVFLGRDFITVSKEESTTWEHLQLDVMAAIMEHFSSGEEVIVGENAPTASSEDSEVVRQIKELLEARVRPIVAMDGGDIEFAEFVEGVVYLRMRGACAGCPSSTATLKSGVENLLKHFVPEVVSVQAVQD